ncbi:MAG: MFS transporter [Microgenomates group bacterium]
MIKTANTNIKLFVFIRIFAKRVFLPLSAIFFIENAGFTIRDIGLLAAFYSFTQLLVEIPTGYFADKVGRVASIRTGALSCALATALYVIFSNKWGIFAGAMFEAIGYSFLGGAGEALIHDSLVAKKQTHDYTRIMSKAMSISLIANAVLISLVPMTYYFDHRYPFMIGTLAYLSLLFVTFFMHDLPRSISTVKFVFPQFKNIVGKRHILIFGLTFGIISGLYGSGTDTFNLAIKDFGVRPELLGWIFGISSVVGAAMGPFIKYLSHLELSNYLILDVLILAATYVAGFTRSPYILGFFMIIAISFFRYRKIIYQNYLLTIYPSNYKATLVSTMNNLEQLNSVWLPIFITSLAAKTTISFGLGMTGMLALFIFPLFHYSTLRFFAKKPQVVV